MTLWWREVWCRYCGSPPGESCRTATGHRTYAHVERHRDGQYAEFDYEEFGDEPPPVMISVSRPILTVYLPGDAP